MITTARRLESQGKIEFSKLFEKVFPDGADLSVYPHGYRDAVKSREPIFKHFNGDIVVRCELCGKHFTVHTSNIADALKRQKTIDCCSCFEKGNALPVYGR
jgi:hypothetical protein